MVRAQDVCPTVVRTQDVCPTVVRAQEAGTQFLFARPVAGKHVAANRNDRRDPGDCIFKSHVPAIRFCFVGLRRLGRLIRQREVPSVVFVCLAKMGR